MPSPYQWNLNELQKLLDLVHNSAIENHFDRVIIFGDLNFSQTNWQSISSKIHYEKELVRKLIGLSFSIFSNDQLDVVLFNNPDLLIQCD